MGIFNRILPFLIALAAVGVALVFLLGPYGLMEPTRLQDKDILSAALHLVTWRWRIMPICCAICIRALVARPYSIGIWLLTLIAVATLPFNLLNPYELRNKPLPNPKFVPIAQSGLDPSEKILGITIRGESRAYPIRILAYHAILNDQVGGQPVAATYSLLSHSGRVWSRVLGGLVLNLRLIGNANQNVLFQDDKTGSWWQQSIGRSAAGRQLGKRLAVVHGDEMTLRQWAAEHPTSSVLVPQPEFAANYVSDLDAAARKIPAILESEEYSGLVARDLVFGVRIKDDPRAYRVQGLLRARLLMERMGGGVILLVVGPDNQSVRAWRLPKDALPYTRIADSADGTGPVMTDVDGALWNFQGCDQTGKCLEPVEVVKEYWFQWHNNNAETSVSRLR